MLASSPIPKYSVGRTFFIAIITLGVVTLIQLGAVGWEFIRRFHSPPVKESQSQAPLSISLRGIPSISGDTKPVKFTDPFALENPVNTTALPSPTPISQGVLTGPVSPTQGRVAEMLGQARLLRDRDDMSTALTRLREAQALAPEDPAVLSELGITYDKMGLKDKALEFWQKVYGMGKSAGTYYAQAEARLSPTDPRPDDGNSGTTDPAGFPPGSVLALLDITRTNSTDAPEKKFKLMIPLKTRPGAQVAVHDEVIQVFFYEQLDDGTVVLTNSNVVSKFTNENDIQVLEVNYTSASLDPKEKHSENRKYFGYIVRVYYKGSLQDMRADPVKLLKDYPPPLTLSNEDMQ